MNENPVDFTNPDAIADELTAMEATPAAAPKAKKPSKPKVVTVSFTCDRDYAAGETVTFQYEIPKAASRGAVSGIPVEEMTNEQLKIEYRNANSVHYKTVKNGRDASKSAARLEACKAEMTKRGIQPTARSRDIDVNTVANLIKTGAISAEELNALLNA